MATHMKVVGKHLEDPNGQFQVMAEIRTFNTGWPTYRVGVIPMSCCVTRVWSTAVQRWTVMATNENGALIAMTRARTYKEALTTLREMIEG